MRSFSKSISLFLFVVFVSAAESKTIYVNNVVGSDFNTGSLPESQGERVGPLRTIVAALRITNRGDKVELAKTPVPYEECISLQGPRHSGFEFAPFVLNGNGATLDGTAAVPANRWEFVVGDVHRFVPERGGFQMLFLNGEPAKQLPRFDGDFVSAFLKPKEWCRCRGGIHFMPEKEQGSLLVRLALCETSSWHHALRCGTCDHRESYGTRLSIGWHQCSRQMRWIVRCTMLQRRQTDAVAFRLAVHRV